jgi:hypothetical protein
LFSLFPGRLKWSDVRNMSASVRDTWRATCVFIKTRIVICWKIVNHCRHRFKYRKYIRGVDAHRQVIKNQDIKYIHAIIISLLTFLQCHASRIWYLITTRFHSGVHFFWLWFVFRNWNRQSEIQPNWYQTVTCLNLIYNKHWQSFTLLHHVSCRCSFVPVLVKDLSQTTSCNLHVMQLVRI